MYKKTFVSLSFTSNSLQFLQLDPARRKVIKFGEVSVPSGIIVNYKVANIEGLTTLLKSVWKQYSLSEKSVGVIVPEFSTFTKTLNLPALTMPELDEAVRWQAQEFLPDGGADMIMDWKIIKSSATEHQILVVAIHQASLAGYIQAIGDAGLFPLVVETPSLSLVRVASNEQKNRLILYANVGEAILIVANGEKIIGSVVIRSANQNEILAACLNLVHRYTNNTVEKVYMGGLQISKMLADSLKSNLNIDPVWLTYPATQINASQIQQYLIPLSLQLKDPAEPADENSINLLPPQWVNQYQIQKRKIQTWSLLILSTIVIWSCLFAMGGVYFALRSQSAAFQTNSDQSGSSSNTTQKEIQSINALANKVNKIISAYPEPGQIVNAITSSASPSITLQKYSIDFEQGFIKLSGVAADRAALLDFKNKLEANEDFSEINLPLSALLSQQNIVFSLDFTYLPLQPKKNKK